MKPIQGTPPITLRNARSELKQRLKSSIAKHNIQEDCKKLTEYVKQSIESVKQSLKTPPSRIFKATNYYSAQPKKKESGLHPAEIKLGSAYISNHKVEIRKAQKSSCSPKCKAPNESKKKLKQISSSNDVGSVRPNSTKAAAIPKKIKEDSTLPRYAKDTLLAIFKGWKLRAILKRSGISGLYSSLVEIGKMLVSNDIREEDKVLLRSKYPEYKSDFLRRIINIQEDPKWFKSLESINRPGKFSTTALKPVTPKQKAVPKAKKEVKQLERIVETPEKTFTSSTVNRNVKSAMQMKSRNSKIAKQPLCVTQQPPKSAKTKLNIGNTKVSTAYNTSRGDISEDRIAQTMNDLQKFLVSLSKSKQPVTSSISKFNQTQFEVYM
jgi:hypothetical protein